MQLAVDGVAASGAVVIVLVAGDVAGVHELVDDALCASLADADRLGQLPKPHVWSLGEADQRVAVIGNQRPSAAIPEFVDCHDFIVVLSSSAREYCRGEHHEGRVSERVARGLGLPPDGDTRPTVIAAVRRPLPASLRAPVAWGLVFGVGQAASPLSLWWLDKATVYALGLAAIAAIYIGFAVADGRARVIAVESGVATMFVVVAAAAVTGSPWLLVIGLAGHGLKDTWQHRRQFVANTRWWPPFCLVVDFTVAAIIAVEILVGTDFHR